MMPDLFSNEGTVGSSSAADRITAIPCSHYLLRFFNSSGNSATRQMDSDIYFTDCAGRLAYSGVSREKQRSSMRLRLAIVSAISVVEAALKG
jgi:hypothetical protein